jgi:hypothetical protein
LHLPPALALAPLVLTLPTVMIVLGVILPAVWSTDQARRRAASGVLRQLLAALPRRSRAGTGRSDPVSRTS